jgi:hypothetical protein
VKLTKYGLESMGFRELPAGQSITARFEGFRIYNVRGVTLKDGSPIEARVIVWPDVKFAFGNSVNQLTKALVGEDYTDDETEWRTKSGGSPPYLVVLIGPTAAATVAGAFAQRHDGQLITYDAFANLKQELQGREDSVLQSLLPALALAFSDRSHPVSFHQVAREVFGRTDNNETFVDVRLSMSATAYVSSPIADPEFTNLLRWAADLRTSLASDISQFYYLGLFEDDPLKRFLFFFLFIERYTHRTFKTLRQQHKAANLLSIPSRLSISAPQFAEEQQGGAKTLTARFMWCAIQSWLTVGDDDVTRFLNLKRKRDQLSHGELTTVSTGLALEAEQLAAKLVRCGVPQPGAPSEPSTAGAPGNPG